MKRSQILRSLTICLGLLWLPVACQSSKQTLRAKGQPFTDSLYGATVVRITDKTIDKYSGNGIQNEYARADYWNSDGSRLLLRSNDGHFYLYDAESYQLLRNLSDLSGGQELEPRWSRSNSCIFYYLAGSRLMKFDIARESALVVHDFRREFPGCCYVTTGVEGDASDNQQYWAFMITDSSFRLQAVCVYDLEADSVMGRKTTFPDEVNFVTMDISGRHVVIGYDELPMQAFHRDFSHEVNLPHGAAGHSDVALTSDNRDVVVYQNVATDYIALTDLETGNETNLQLIPFDVNPDIGLHISGNCVAVPGWVLVSTYGALNPPPGKRHSWMDNLLYLLELKPDGRIVKLAQTHCYTGVSPQSRYFAEAFASINRAGTKVVYGSNWGVLEPEDYTDAYEVRLPSGWH